MSSRAFVVHSSKDLSFVRQLRADLRQRGVDAITSDNIIKPGAEFATQLERIIRVTPVIILVLSKASADRPWVATEISLALSQQLSGEPKLLIPVLAEADVELPFFIRNLQFVDMSSRTKYKEGIDALADAIQSWRADDEAKRESQGSRIRLIEAERQALELEKLAQAATRRDRVALLASALATLAGALAALFAGSTSLGLLKVGWVSPSLAWGFVAGAISGAAAMALFIVSRRRSRDLLHRRRQ